MNGFETDTAPVWDTNEQNILLLAREQEWAEAYSAENPDCAMGRVYLDFLRREMILLLSEI